MLSKVLAWAVVIGILYYVVTHPHASSGDVRYVIGQSLAFVKGL